MSAEITRQILQTAPAPGLPGWETRLVLVTYGPGADGSGHSHPVPGIGMILEGAIISAFDDDPEETISAGQSFKDRASLHRVARNASTTAPVRFLVAYTVREGQPNTV